MCISLRMTLIFSLASFLFIYGYVNTESFQCRDQANEPVDWYVFYKLPRNKASSSKDVRDGIAFLYIDSNSGNWTTSVNSIASKEQTISYTLQQNYLFADDSNMLSIYYNDEFPYLDKVSTDHGHTKGVVAFYNTSGYWLIHSVPKFPRIDSYEYAKNAKIYGQMGICVTFSTLDLDKIAIQLFYNHPYIYSIKVPTIYKEISPILQKIQSGGYMKGKNSTNIVSLRSMNGQQFLHFAKTADYRKDIYFDFVAQALKSDLFVETWQHGDAYDLGSTCKPGYFNVFDVKTIMISTDQRFNNLHDHSKYAITVSDASPNMKWVCIGDINRQKHQLQRGGGTMCVDNINLHSVFKKMVLEVKPCQ